ncbi:MAG: hypothetical protein IKU50_06405 [Bacteroidaceae bacterium]|nr:hypothetical protein [Bacteroidaceae bacterium]
MKPINITLAILMYLFTISLSSCEKDNDNGDTEIHFEIDDLYGSWKYESGETCSLYYFSAEDSSGIYIENAQSRVYDRYDITYETNDKVTSLTIIKGSGDSTRYTIFSLTGNELILTDTENEATLALERYNGNINDEYPHILKFAIDNIYGNWEDNSNNPNKLYYFSAEDSSGIYIENAQSKNYNRFETTYETNVYVTSLTIFKENGDSMKYAIDLLNRFTLILKDTESGNILALRRHVGNIDKEFPVTINSDTLNGHEWVNLGLSVKWATCNIGATNPEDYGDYFSWGNIEPSETYIKKTCATWNKNISDFSGNPKYDAATANWGDGWRMPTKAEMQELRKECTWEWTTINNTNGYKVTGINGNSIFLPAAGYYNAERISNSNENGYYWTTTPYEYNNQESCKLDFYESFPNLLWYNRYFGLSIRPVSK